MTSKVAIVTGVSSGIGLGITKALLERGYAIVGTSREATRKTPLAQSRNLTLVDGDVGVAETAERVVQAALSKYDRIDLLVNNAGIFIAKPFTEYTQEDYAKLVSTTLAGFFHLTQRVLAQMVTQKSGHIVSISTSLVATPIAGVPASLPILLKGGLEAATKALAIEYASQGVRVNAVAAGPIDTPMHPKENHPFLSALNPMNRMGTVQEMTEAVLYLSDANFVSGEVLHVDGGAHAGKW